ncbi:phage portal protein [Brevibacterium sp. 239c]|uniref:phage portal protein n=1 Tax=Brevibacterium sp. 239c TaxID=1965356 RepID=UPI0015E11DA0|nr:phage portal protein [Brevibacterium sp. 239c]
MNAYPAEVQAIRSLLEEWRRRWPKNVQRSLYYDTEQAFKDLGIALPPQLKKAKFVLGWGTQAVKKPAMRSQFEGLRLPGSDDPFELSQIFTQNRFPLEFSQSVVSAGTHGMSLVTVAKGRAGEAPVQIQAHSAESCAALWDRRNRRLGAALTIGNLSEDRPTEFVVYLPDVVLECSYTKGSGWLAKRHPNTIGRVLAVPVTHDPQLRRPFGRSRLTNAVMALNDMAVRAYVRMEANAEFYSTPQIALLGVDPEAFSGQMSESMKFKLAMDRLIALTKDQDGEKPELTQLSQASMAPHSDMLRTVAMAFSGETGIPPSSLGIIHDQPSSAEAIRANEHDMLVDVTYQNKFVLSDAVREIAILTVMVRDGLRDVPEEAWSLSSRFVDPEFQSLSAQSDAVQKLASQMPILAQYPVLLEQIFDDNQVERIRSDQRRSTVSEFMRGVQERGQVTPEVQEAANAGVVRQVEP